MDLLLKYAIITGSLVCMPRSGTHLPIVNGDLGVPTYNYYLKY